MITRKTLALAVLFCLPFMSVLANEHKSYEMPRTQVIPIKDTQSNKQYELLIKLPESYADHKNQKYPVIYFTDAIWHIELLSSATSFIMEDVILVGISWQKDVEKALKEEHGEYVSRFRDYSFLKSNNPERQAKYKLGQANNHLAFIRKDVFSFVEENYRTVPGNRSYFGFSAGGLFGAYTLMVQPDTFKNYLLGSPSLWQLAKLEAEADISIKNLHTNVFVSNGALEEELSSHINDFVSLMAKREDNTLKLKHVVIDSSGHSDSFPMMGLRSIKWLANLQEKRKK